MKWWTHMTLARASLILSLALVARPGAAPAAAAPATRPASITLHARAAPARQVFADFARQAGAPLPVTPPELFQTNPPPDVTLDLDRQPFWRALETLGRKTGLEPVVSPDDPYPRLVLGLGGGAFWQEPHVVSGPLVIFANDVERANAVDLKRAKPPSFDRRVTINLTAFVEPGLCVLSVSQVVKVKSAVDEARRALKPVPGDEETPTFSPLENPGNGLFRWNLAIVLDSPPAGARKVARLVGVTHLRVQTASDRLEIDDVLKVRNVTRTVAGVPFTFRSLKKADIEYVLQLSLRRVKKGDAQWGDLHGSIYNGHMALYDAQGRLVAARATENGGDYGSNKIDATLRFVREPGVSDPKAGEPYKLVWLAPTQTKDVAVPFELVDLPIPE